MFRTRIPKKIIRDTTSSNDHSPNVIRTKFPETDIPIRIIILLLHIYDWSFNGERIILL